MQSGHNLLIFNCILLIQGLAHLGDNLGGKLERRWIGESITMLRYIGLCHPICGDCRSPPSSLICMTLRSLFAAWADLLDAISIPPSH